AVGMLLEPHLDKHGKILSASIRTEDGDIVEYRAKSMKELFKHERRKEKLDDEMKKAIERIGEIEDLKPGDFQLIHFDDNFFDILSGSPQEGENVIVASYMLRNVRHFIIRRADQTLSKIYDNEILPRYLFIGAALMTLGILLLLCRKLPDFFVRSVFWFKTLGKFRLKAVGMHHLPTEGPVILVTNCKDMQSCLQLVSATDRTTKVVLVDDRAAMVDGILLRNLAERANFILVRPDDDVQTVWQEALTTLQNGHLLAISLVHEEHAADIAALLQKLRQQTSAPVLPVYCGSLDDGAAAPVTPRVRVVFGEVMTRMAVDLTTIQAGAPMSTAIQTLPADDGTLANCKKAIDELGEWIRENDDRAGSD